jgi:hypothetical protein
MHKSVLNYRARMFLLLPFIHIILHTFFIDIYGKAACIYIHIYKIYNTLRTHGFSLTLPKPNLMKSPANENAAPVYMSHDVTSSL